MTVKIVYHVGKLPDSGYPPYRLMAGGDVARAIRECHEHLLRTLITYLSGSAGLAIRYIFTPTLNPSERRCRLTIMLIVRAQNERVARNLRVLIECSDLSTYYGLQPAATPGELPAQYRAGCDIVRTERAIQPLHTADSNPAIPSVYYTCQPFSPQTGNDYLMLDRVLDRVDEQVMFEVAVEPADLSHERILHTNDIARLQSINRPGGLDDEDNLLCNDPFEADAFPRGGGLNVIQPLRRRDPIADDVLRDRRRFHETLTQPHLRFHMRVLAQTSAVAQLIASVIAESAFKEGSYSLRPCGADGDCFQQMLASAASANVFTQSTLDQVLGEHASEYRGFARLAHVASVDELLGVFAIPVAGRSQPRCICKNTEPAFVPMEDLLILGHDE